MFLFANSAAGKEPSNNSTTVLPMFAPRLYRISTFYYVYLLDSFSGRSLRMTRTYSPILVLLFFLCFFSFYIFFSLFIFSEEINVYALFKLSNNSAYVCRNSNAIYVETRTPWRCWTLLFKPVLLRRLPLPYVTLLVFFQRSKRFILR